MGVNWKLRVFIQYAEYIVLCIRSEVYIVLVELLSRKMNFHTYGEELIRL